MQYDGDTPYGEVLQPMMLHHCHTLSETFDMGSSSVNYKEKLILLEDRCKSVTHITVYHKCVLYLHIQMLLEA